MGKCPDGQMSNGQMPDGQMLSMGKCPDGQMPSNRIFLDIFRIFTKYYQTADPKMPKPFKVVKLGN